MTAKVYPVIPKDERYRNQKILDAAEGGTCTVQSPFCNMGDTVWCHSNYPEHGKGTSLKAHDIYGCIGCDPCHRWLDQGTKWPTNFVQFKERKEAFMRAMCRSWLVLVRKGVLK